MSNEPLNSRRRAVLQATAGLAAAGSWSLGTASAAAKKPLPTGKQGDFEFLSGEWRIQNRRMQDGRWDQFDGEATVHGILQGVGSIEELRIPARNFSGMGLRLLDVERKLWADYWVNGRSGVLAPPPAWGSFIDGAGIWDSDDMDGSQPIIVRGVWDQVTPDSCRWFQAVSRDDGRTWQENWIMHWQRR